MALLFVGLLVVATVLAWTGGAGWPLMLLAGALLTVFVAGLAVHSRLGSAGRSMWVGLLFLGTVALMVLSRDFLWVVFPLWLLAATVLPLLASLLLTAVTLAVVVTVLAMTDGHTVGAVLGPLVGALGELAGLLQRGFHGDVVDARGEDLLDVLFEHRTDLWRRCGTGKSTPALPASTTATAG